jgi:hypothetical protein
MLGEHGGLDRDANERLVPCHQTPGHDTGIREETENASSVYRPLRPSKQQSPGLSHIKLTFRLRRCECLSLANFSG